MIPYRLAAGPHRFNDLNVEQEHANRDDEIADSDWHAAVKDRRHGKLGHKGYLEDHAFPLIGERHIEKKNDHVEERKRDEQEWESDQVHASWLSSREVCKTSSADDFRRATIAARALLSESQTSFLALSTWRPRYMPVFRSMGCGRRSSPESLSSTYVGRASASAERRIPRRDGDILRFGTAIVVLLVFGAPSRRIV